MNARLSALLLAGLVAVGGCDDDDGMEPPEETTFQVRVENVSTVYEFPASGVFAVPDGASEPGPAGPGASFSFEFSAGPGSRLSFATMFGQSNDLFYAPDEEGIALFDGQGQQVTGDVTSQVRLWDAGTEANQEPGLGADQAPRQSGPDTGADDPDNTVRIAEDEFGNLPGVSDVIRVTLESLGETRFRLKIENVSTASTLMTSDGGSHPAPVSPGVFVIHTEPGPLFQAGEPDRGEGLERIAEDGMPTTLADAVGQRTGLTTPLSPGAWAVHTGTGPFFTSGEADRGQGLEAIAEDGMPSMLVGSLQGQSGIVTTGAFTTPEGASAAGPAGPGSAYVFTVSAVPGQRLSLVTMFVQSNDLFYAPDEAGIALFTGSGLPRTGDVTSELALWDAGTEVNQRPGVGLDQVVRQAGPDTGEDEGGVVRLVDDEFEYPEVSDVIRVTIQPEGMP